MKQWHCPSLACLPFHDVLHFSISLSFDNTYREGREPRGGTLIDSDSEPRGEPITPTEREEREASLPQAAPAEEKTTPAVSKDATGGGSASMPTAAKAPPGSSPLLPLMTTRPTAVKTLARPPPRLLSPAYDAYEWAIRRMSGELALPPPPSISRMPASPMHAHPHAQPANPSLRVKVHLSESRCDDDVVEHIRHIIANRKQVFKPFYIGATTRLPLERFNLPTRPSHAEVYDGMVVGWVGNATDAIRIERFIIRMGHQSFRQWCVNKLQTGGEGIHAEREHASVYMC